jgi:Domain of unknown function (DUF4189)
MMTIRSMITRAAVAAVLATGATVLAAAPASASPNSWAAIAISVETGNIGYSYEQPSASAAASAAEDECGAGDCQEVVRVTNGCAAVAQASNLAWGWAYGASLSEAKRAAVNATPGRGAEVLAYACTGAYLG